VRATFAAIFTVFTVLGACTNKTPEPAALGNCVPSPDGAPCPAGMGMGAGAGRPSDAGEAGDARPTDASIQDAIAVDATAADSLFVTQFPGCPGCIMTPSEAGARTCTAEDSTCSSNTACLMVLQCQLALNPTCAVFSPQGVTDFNQFATCLASVCPTLCPFLPLLDAGGP
jgi:hypothetical protein